MTLVQIAGGVVYEIDSECQKVVLVVNDTI
jgi:hypothetical protein